LSEYACAVSGLAVGIYGSAMRKIADGFYSAFHHAARRMAREVGHESNSARVALKSRVIERALRRIVFHLFPRKIQKAITLLG
jgi:hypothetical protein